jgi:hypothetical protein
MNEETQRLGDHRDLPFDTRPGSGMSFSLSGLRYPAFQDCFSRPIRPSS